LEREELLLIDFLARKKAFSEEHSVRISDIPEVLREYVNNLQEKGLIVNAEGKIYINVEALDARFIGELLKKYRISIATRLLAISISIFLVSLIVLYSMFHVRLGISLVISAIIGLLIAVIGFIRVMRLFSSGFISGSGDRT